VRLFGLLVGLGVSFFLWGSYEFWTSVPPKSYRNLRFRLCQFSSLPSFLFPMDDLILSSSFPPTFVFFFQILSLQRNSPSCPLLGSPSFSPPSLSPRFHLLIPKSKQTNLEEGASFFSGKHPTCFRGFFSLKDPFLSKGPTIPPPSWSRAHFVPGLSLEESGSPKKPSCFFHWSGTCFSPFPVLPPFSLAKNPPVS